MPSGRPAGFADLGIEVNDFIDNEETDFGRNVTVEVVTGTIDYRGKYRETFSAGTTQKVVFHERSKTLVRTADGQIEIAPAYMMHRITLGIGTGDRITVDGKQWKVFNVIERDGIFNYSELYHW